MVMIRGHLQEAELPSPLNKMTGGDSKGDDEDEDEDGNDDDMFAPSLTTNFPFPPTSSVPVCLTTVNLSGESAKKKRKGSSSFSCLVVRLRF